MDKPPREPGLRKPSDLLQEMKDTVDRLRTTYGVMPEAIAGSYVDVIRIEHHLKRTQPTTPFDLTGIPGTLWGVLIFKSVHIQPGKFYAGTRREIADLVDWLEAPRVDPLHALGRVLVPYLSEADAVDLLTRYELQHLLACPLARHPYPGGLHNSEPYCTCGLVHLAERIKLQVQTTGWEQNLRKHMPPPLRPETSP